MPWILDEFAYYFETRYNQTLLDDNFATCNIDRPAVASATGRMGLVNHMMHFELFDIQAPDEISAEWTNSVASVTAQASLCSSAYGRAPNVVLVCVLFPVLHCFS